MTNRFSPFPDSFNNKHSMSNNVTSLRERVDVDLLGNINTHNILHYFGEDEKKDVTKKKFKGLKKSNVHLELKLPLFFGQLISLLPIYGVLNSDYTKLHFRWRSIKLIYSAIMVCMTFILCGLSINRYINEKGVTYSSIGDIMFYGSSLLSSIFFIKFVVNWKDIVMKWHAIQCEINNFESLAVRRKIRFLTIFMIISSFFEHVLSNTQTMQITEDKDLIKNFFYNSNIFSNTNFNIWTAMFIYFINFLITFIWNYPDLFISSISLSLANMFRQFNNDLEMSFGKLSTSRDVSQSYWKRKREIYNSLCLLVKMVEKNISHIVLLSFANNVYFICVQLLNSIQPVRSWLQVVYFCGSFGHILFRICTVCYTASSIYENSKEPLSILFTVPSEQYNTEVQRLITQIANETLALTGCKFFTVTRNLMLTIAGTIITYEVVLVQFNGLNNDSQAATPATFNRST